MLVNDAVDAVYPAMAELYYPMVASTATAWVILIWRLGWQAEA